MKTLTEKEIAFIREIGAHFDEGTRSKWERWKAEALGGDEVNSDDDSRRAQFIRYVQNTKNEKIKTPVVTVNDLIALLTTMKSQAVGKDADLTIVLGEQRLIVSEVCWNDMGDEVEIRTFKGE